MTRQEHLEWCKQRALEYVDAGNIGDAWASMVSDLKKHEETSNHRAIELGTMMIMGGHLSSPAKMREFILGCN